MWRAHIDGIVDGLRGDTRHGSAHLAVAALDGLAGLGELQPLTADELDAVVSIVGDARPAMATVRNAARATVELVGEGAAWAEAVDRVRRRMAADEARAVAAAAGVASGAVVVSCSRSGTVERGLTGADPSPELVRALVSDPGGEGLDLAQALREAAIAVEPINDAMARAALEDADVVLVGADAITPHGVVNKAGTWTLASAAADAGVPVTVAASGWKRADDWDPAWAERVEDARVPGPRFELVPWDLIDGVVPDRSRPRR